MAGGALQCRSLQNITVIETAVTRSERMRAREVNLDDKECRIAVMTGFGTELAYRPVTVYGCFRNEKADFKAPDRHRARRLRRFAAASFAFAVRLCLSPGRVGFLLNSVAETSSQTKKRSSSRLSPR